MGLVDEIRQRGGTPGPTTIWLGAWNVRSGTGNFRTFFDACKQRDITPLVYHWWFGDDISPTAIRSGVRDRYQKDASGNPILKTSDKAAELLISVMGHAQAAGVRPVVVIEHEFTKASVLNDPIPFNDYFRRMADIVHAKGGRTAICPGVWADMAKVRAACAPALAASDIYGLQTLLFRPRHAESNFRDAGAILERQFKALRGADTKPTAIVDLGFSSYGGNYSTTHPFAGGNGQTGEPLQAEAFGSVLDHMPAMPALEFVCVRSLRDHPTFDVANYGGYAERHMGIQRADGTPKPSHAVVLEMAIPPPPPPPPTVPKEDYDRVITERDRARQDLTDALQRLEQARRASQALIAALGPP